MKVTVDTPETSTRKVDLTHQKTAKLSQSMHTAWFVDSSWWSLACPFTYLWLEVIRLNNQYQIKQLMSNRAVKFKAGTLISKFPLIKIHYMYI